jgi:hypothetical protein
MMLGLEYAVHANTITIRQRWMAPGEYADSLIAVQVLQFKRRIVVAATRCRFFYGDGSTLQRNCLVIKAPRIGNNGMDGNLGRFCGAYSAQHQSPNPNKYSRYRAVHRVIFQIEFEHRT